MPESRPFDALAEAIADGQDPDWASAEQSADTEDRQAFVSAFRGLAAVGRAFAVAARTAGTDAAPRTILRAGTMWGSLRIIEHVGRGRFGDVYRAWDPALDRPVALKLITSDATRDVEAQVVEEGRLMARVRHPNVATIHGAQRIDQVTGLWMEFVEGHTLEAELAAQGVLGAAELADVGQQLSEALSAVHGAGLVHRDVKASNALRETSGRVVLGDFGTGRELEVEADERRGMVGTPAYLAPEIFDHAAATPRSDVYSLGVLLFHLATGRYPFEARSLRALRDAHVEGGRQSLREARPDLPSGLVAIVDRALRVDAQERFGSAAEMAQAFVEQKQLGRRRRRQLVQAVVAVLALVLTTQVAWRSAPAPMALDAPGWVLVTAVDNRTGEAALDGVDVALREQLATASFVNVVPRARVEETLALMRQPLDVRLDERTALEVATRDGHIQVVVSGEVARAGASYVMTARLWNPRDGSEVERIVEPFDSLADAMPALARLAAGARDALGRHLPGLQRGRDDALPRVTTHSLAALNYYQQALPDLVSTGDHGAAERLLREAVREDPGFAMAHIALAQAIWAQRFLGPEGIPPREFRAREIDTHLDAARVASSHLEPFARDRVRFESARLQENRSQEPARTAHRQAALAALQALAERQPNDAWVLEQRLRFEEPSLERTLPLARQLIALRPRSLEVLDLAASRAVDAGDLESARSFLDLARPLIDVPAATTSLGDAAAQIRILMFEDAWSQDDTERAAILAEELAAMNRLTPPESSVGLAEALVRVYLALGQLSKAAEVAVGTPRTDGMRHLLLGVVEVSRQDPESARAFLDRHAINGHSGNASLFLGLFDVAGRSDDFRLAAAQVRRRPGVPPQGLVMIEALSALIEGQPLRTIELLEPLMTPAPGLAESKALAEAWVAAGRPDEAIGVLERASAQPRQMRRPTTFQAHHWLNLQDRLATLYRESGRTGDAQRIDGRLAVLLKFADPDHPIRRRLDSRDGGS